MNTRTLFHVILTAALSHTAFAQPTTYSAGDAPPTSTEEPESWQVGPACGPNALFCMFRIKNITLHYDELMTFLNPSAKGSTLKELENAANKWGLNAKAYKVNKDEYQRLPTPFIAHLEYQGILHYVLVVSSDTKSIEVWNAEKGFSHKVPQGKFKRMWSGYVLSENLKYRQTDIFLVVGAVTVLIGIKLSTLTTRSNHQPTQRISL